MAYNNYDRRRRKEDAMRKLGLLAVAAIAIAVAFLFASKLADRKNVDPAIKGAAEATTQEKAEDIITIDGVDYRQRDTVKAYLFIGEDDTGSKEAKSEYDGTGQSDVLQLLVIDKDKGSYTRIPINRDTMTEVKSLDEDGTYLATGRIQISFAHANGDGLETSCENTVDAVEGLFHGINIQEYACLNLDGIKTLNHMADGVTVTIEDDFSKEDPSLKMGETITLDDDQAYHYVHGRMSVADGSNENRMKRQKTYLAELTKKYRQKQAEDDEFAIRLYQELQDHMVTSLSIGDVSRLAKSLMTCKDQGETEIEGKTRVGEDEYIEFEADRDCINQITKDLFLEEAEE